MCVLELSFAGVDLDDFLAKDRVAGAVDVVWCQ